LRKEEGSTDYGDGKATHEKKSWASKTEDIRWIERKEASKKKRKVFGTTKRGEA